MSSHQHKNDTYEPQFEVCMVDRVSGFVQCRVRYWGALLAAPSRWLLYYSRSLLSLCSGARLRYCVKHGSGECGAIIKQSEEKWELIAKLESHKLRTPLPNCSWGFRMRPPRKGDGSTLLSMCFWPVATLAGWGALETEVCVRYKMVEPLSAVVRATSRGQ